MYFFIEVVNILFFFNSENLKSIFVKKNITMKFNIQETQLLIKILKFNLEKKNPLKVNKEISYQTIIEKLENGDYIKGRLLNFLLTEITASDFYLDESNKLKTEEIVKKIKFKATPR